MKTITFACADEPTTARGVANAVAIDSLCAKPIQLVDHASGADQAILLLHEGAFDLAEVQKALRMTEIDPLGAQILRRSSKSNLADVPLAALGLKGRAEAFSGSLPEHAKPVLPRSLTRRGLLKLPAPEYLAAPMVDHAICAAGDGCHACVDVCPREAYRWRRGRVHYNKEVCEPCGLCVTTCPTEAISNPAATPAMLAAQIRALIDGAGGPIGVRFVCTRREDHTPIPDWYDIEVPCTGMVPGTWLLASALMGAAAATILPCSIGGCTLGLDHHAQEAVDFARTALTEAALNPDLVPTAAAELGTSIARGDLNDPFGRKGPVEVVLGLFSLTNRKPDFTHEGAGMGVVEIDSSTCTLCTQCAKTCPTGALSHAYTGDVVSLTFDAATCTSCRQCTLVCPEFRQGAISVIPRVDVRRLTAGRSTVNQGGIRVCESCGQPIAPSQMMDRIGELLGNDFTDTMDYLNRRCLDCRGL